MIKRGATAVDVTVTDNQVVVALAAVASLRHRLHGFHALKMQRQISA
jgi:hypothetical protein